MRYKLRSSSKSRSDDSVILSYSSGSSGFVSPSSSSSSESEKKNGMDTASDECSPPKLARVYGCPPQQQAHHHQHRRRKKQKTVDHLHQGPQICSVLPPLQPSKRTITDLPQELILHISSFLDSRSLLAMLQTSKWFYNLLKDCNSYWKNVCLKEELANYSCLLSEPAEGSHQLKKLGWNLMPMRCNPPSDLPSWRRVFLKGLQMRRNIRQSNFEGWRIFSNSNLPVVKLTPDLDMNEVKRRMGDFPKLSENDDLKIDWDDKHLVVFHFFRGEGESCTIRLWDISEEPRFIYSVDKGLECITDKVSVVNDHVVIVPSWPLEANAIVMTLDTKNHMAEAGKFIFPDEFRQNALDEQWEHTQLRVIKNEAMVACRCPEWCVLVVSLPSCQLLYEVGLSDVSILFDCQQIRSYKNTAMILFSRKQNESCNILTTVDVAGADTKVRSCYPCVDVADVALFTDPEEIYIMKRNGNVVMYDATAKMETVKIINDESPTSSSTHSEYQLFVNRKEQICVMQCSSDVPQGRYINVYSFNEQKLYTINLDLMKYGILRDESICLYTNGAFLAAADSKKFTLFNVKTGKYLGTLKIPIHLERTKGKEEKDCMFEQTGLTLFIFDEDKLIAMHDYERSFPAVLDIYKFW